MDLFGAIEPSASDKEASASDIEALDSAWALAIAGRAVKALIVEVMSARRSVIRGPFAERSGLPEGPLEVEGGGLPPVRIAEAEPLAILPLPLSVAGANLACTGPGKYASYDSYRCSRLLTPCLPFIGLKERLDSVHFIRTQSFDSQVSFDGLDNLGYGLSPDLVVDDIVAQLVGGSDDKLFPRLDSGVARLIQRAVHMRLLQDLLHVGDSLRLHIMIII
jgi:hypothetical protein